MGGRAGRLQLKEGDVRSGVIEFPNEEKAEGVREILLAMQKEYLIELGDAVIAVKEADERIKLFQPVTQDAASGKL